MPRISDRRNGYSGAFFCLHEFLLLEEEETEDGNKDT